MSRPRSGERREEILQILARMLQESPGEHITTAALAKSVGVSVAALYRHFPSKAKMFEGLIEFIEDSVFGLINRILQEDKQANKRCERILTLLLGFAQKNPGITRLMTGDVLTGDLGTSLVTKKPVLTDSAGKVYNTSVAIIDPGSQPEYKCSFPFRVPAGTRVASVQIDTAIIDLAALDKK